MTVPISGYLRLVLAPLLITILFASPSLQAAPDIAAEIRYQSQAITPDGITKSSRHIDHFIRAGEQVWLERQIPAAVRQHPHDHHEDHPGQGHHRLDVHDVDLDAAAKYITRLPDGKADLTFVNRPRKLTVHIESENYQTVGFNGDWNTAYNLIDPAHVKKMRPLLHRPAPAGRRWYTESDERSYLNILWDQAKGFPLQIESGQRDGSLKRTVTIHYRPLPKTLPWTQLRDYSAKDYNDLLD